MQKVCSYISGLLHVLNRRHIRDVDNRIVIQFLLWSGICSVRTSLLCSVLIYPMLFPAFSYTSVISSSVVRLKSPGMLFLMADAVRAKLMSFGLSSPNFSRA